MTFKDRQLNSVTFQTSKEKFLNRPFYRYGGHIELIGFKKYHGMPGGHENDPIYSHQYVRGLFGPIFLFKFS